MGHYEQLSRGPTVDREKDLNMRYEERNKKRRNDPTTAITQVLFEGLLTRKGWPKEFAEQVSWMVVGVIPVDFDEILAWPGHEDTSKVVPPTGFEPVLPKDPNFKSGASANSAKGEGNLKISGVPCTACMGQTLRNIKVPFGWGLEVCGVRTVPNARHYQVRHYQVRITCGKTIDNMTGEEMDGWNGRWWRLSVHMTPGEIVQTVFKAVMTAIEHEAREMFLYKGVPVLDPHYDIEKLVEFRKQAGNIKGRDAV